ncbi:hypothetical protein JCM10914A_40650 [Paenibacillus sp. JCM 10914]|uniref:PAAR domain-containing protein n=1 Tax=Paenibacillus sp. JCM 10914 TaxID=1236974 RepID=UPI000B2F0CE1|nr:PAAR domain-containing protein [Paenibacillus sp. JCM 10914]
MAGIATHGSASAPVTKRNYVSYDVYSYDDFYGWNYSYSGYSDARITSSGVNANSTVYINGRSIATVDNPLSENWVATSIPSNNSYTEYRNINPNRSGTGQGRVTTGSSNVFSNHKAVAKIGSQVTTCLGELTTITTGSSNVFTS